MKKKRLSEKAALELYRVTMASAETHPGIVEKLANLGYDAESLNAGKLLLAETRSIYDSCKVDRAELSALYRNLIAKRDLLSEPFLPHRKLARVAFRKDKPTLEKLSIKHKVPISYIDWVETVKSFYAGVTANPDILAKLARFNVSSDELYDGLAQIIEVEAARVEYLKKKADSQSATQRKSATFEKIFDWMRDFYEVAKIAFTDDPQMLEAFSKVVKS